LPHSVEVVAGHRVQVPRGPGLRDASPQFECRPALDEEVGLPVFVGQRAHELRHDEDADVLLESSEDHSIAARHVCEPVTQ